MKGSSVLVIGAVIVIVCILIFGLPFDIGSLWGNGFNEGASLTFTINYVDGTSRTIGPTVFQPFTLTITDSGKEVESVAYKINLKPVYEGTLSSYDVYGGVFVELRDLEDMIYGNKIVSKVIEPTGSTWASGESKIVDQETITATEIDNKIQTLGLDEGQYKLYLETEIAMTLNFSPSGSETLNVHGEAGWTFDYSHTGTFKSLSVTLQWTPTYTS